MSVFNKAMIEPLNFHPAFANLLTADNFAMLGLIPDINRTTSRTIDLETLNNYTTHNDHDASLSRLDRIQSTGQYASGGTPLWTLIPGRDMISKLLADAPGQWINTRSLALSRIRRDRESLAAGSPPLDEKDGMAVLNQAAVIIQFIGEGGDPNEAGIADVDSSLGKVMWDARLASKRRVAEWLEFERFPKGWRRTRHQVTADGDMLPIVNRIEYWRGVWERPLNGTASARDE